MPFTLGPATPQDAPAMAAIYLLPDPSELHHLMLGTAVEDDVTDATTERMKFNMGTGQQQYMVARDDETGEVVAFAQWILPREMGGPKDEATKGRETAEYRTSLAPGINLPLAMTFRERLLAMREEALKNRRHYLLQNLGTIPHYRRKGAASALAKWAFERADEEGVIVFLDTAEDGFARQMYGRLGFGVEGELRVDLREFGGQSECCFLGMVREPNVKSRG